MARITINLLPTEFTSERVKDARFIKIQAFGVAMILLIIFLSSLTIALRLLQSQRLKQVEGNLDGARQTVVSFQSRQVSLVALKDRLNGIHKYLGVSSPQAQMYNFLIEILPSSIAINSFTVDQSGNAAFSATVPDSALLDSLIMDLTNKEKNQGRIKEVSIDSLNRSREGVFRVGLKIKAT